MNSSLHQYTCSNNTYNNTNEAWVLQFGEHTVSDTYQTLELECSIYYLFVLFILV